MHVEPQKRDHMEPFFPLDAWVCDAPALNLAKVARDKRIRTELCFRGRSSVAADSSSRFRSRGLCSTAKGARPIAAAWIWCHGARCPGRIREC